MKTSVARIAIISIIISILLSACSAVQGLLPTEAPTATTAPSATLEPSATSAPTETQPPAATEEPTATAEPSSTPIVHTMVPDEFAEMGSPFYDVESSGTGLKKYAPFGDVFDLNRFERPFTQNDMTYQPALDIEQFNIVQYGEWNYAFIKSISAIQAADSNPHYGVEIDIDRDGFGDLLIWAHGPFTTEWTTNGVMVLNDSNRDTGGINPLLSEAPLAIDGYETVLFENGSGTDPDLAWARLSPKDKRIIQIAFKVGLTAGPFMWNAWADAGLMNPSSFNYNDRITLSEAGSPLKDNANYPLKGLYSVDNTCRAPVGFEANGSEPLLCGGNEVAKPEKNPEGGCKVIACPFLQYFDKKSCSCQRFIIIIPTPTPVIIY